MSKEIQTLTRRIQTAQGPAEKSRIMQEMGNIRYDRYRMTNDPDERRLAANCYLASRSFFWRGNQATRAIGSGVLY